MNSLHPDLIISKHPVSYDGTSIDLFSYEVSILIIQLIHEYTKATCRVVVV